MKKIYLVHEYGAEVHFKALYDYAEQYGFQPSKQIILLKRQILKRFLQAIQKGHIYSGLINFIINIHNHILLRFLKNEIVIVGIAPYDFNLNKYKKIFKRNKSYYFTSQTTWNGSDFPKGNITNKTTFETILKECFIGAFCVSKTTEKQVKQYIPNTSLVNHAIDFNKYTKRLTSKNSTMKYLFIGVFNERKNILLILDWLKEHKNANIQITFIGQGPLEKNINLQARKDKRIINLGFHSKEQLQNELCTYDFVILPSKKEPFGIVLLESLAAGTPCIVSNAIGPQEIIDNGTTGFIFDLKEERNNFNQVMQKSLNLTQKERETMRQAACESGKKYDAKVIVKKWISLLNTNT